ncbi:MAG: arylesterase [Balneolales bacterium]
MTIRFHLSAIALVLSLFGFTIFETKNVVFFGDSLTAGYGIDVNQAYPALIQQKIKNAEDNYNVINAGLSGETSAGGLRRIDWILRNDIDVFILGLGANDGLRGLHLEATRQNLQQIIDKVKNKNPEVKLMIAGMQIPPNLGAKYAQDFQEIYIELADKNNAILIPFLLEGVAGEPELNQPDGIHPNPEGHKIIANTVWEILKQVL